jgi:cytochrome c-type biogenesis protein CcmH
MTRVLLTIAFIVLSVTPVAQAQYHSEDPRLEKLYTTFISPCCWRENLTVHDSDIARELRTRIRVMVQEGRSDEQIKAVLVKQYSTQILALPEGATGTWLFLMPWIAVSVGAAGLLFLLRRMRTQAPQVVSDGSPLPELENGWDLD